MAVLATDTPAYKTVKFDEDEWLFVVEVYDRKSNCKPDDVKEAFRDLGEVDVKYFTFAKQEFVLAVFSSVAHGEYLCFLVGWL
jgi:hypothetical protein